MKCIVIGGGVAGVTAIKGLRECDSEVEIVLVDPKGYMEVHWASYRAPFDETVAEGSVFDLTEFCAKNNVTHVQSMVEKLAVGESSVSLQLKNGTALESDVCVVATGAGYTWQACGRGPPKEKTKSRQHRLDELKEEGERLINAESVVVVGGGLIGVELAGDIAYFKKKSEMPVQVLLVERNKSLCHQQTGSAPGMMKDKLEKLGVEVILEETVDDSKAGEAKLVSSGRVIKADAIIRCQGNSPVNDFLDSSLTDEKGWVMVDENFLVKGCNGLLFSIGDCCDLLPSSASQLFLNKAVMGKNISTTLKALEEKKSLEGLQLKKHVEGPTVLVSTIGVQDGVFSSPWFDSQWILPWLKNKTMFFFRVKSELGL